MLKIRLQRIGKKGQAYFRIVAVEHTKKPQGKYLELLGSYNPHEKQFKAEKERIEYWLSKGAQISPTVNNLMVNYKIWDRPKMQSWRPKVKEAPIAAASTPVTPKTEKPADTPALEAEPTPVPETPAEPVKEATEPVAEATAS